MVPCSFLQPCFINSALTISKDPKHWMRIMPGSSISSPDETMKGSQPFLMKYGTGDAELHQELFLSGTRWMRGVENCAKALLLIHMFVFLFLAESDLDDREAYPR